MILRSLILPILLAGLTSGHISLTFPPARYPPLDFLDNLRTQQPCGVPRPLVRKFSNLFLSGLEEEKKGGFWSFIL